MLFINKTKMGEAEPTVGGEGPIMDNLLFLLQVCQPRQPAVLAAETWATPAYSAVALRQGFVSTALPQAAAPLVAQL
jgi:hypothetical protein